MTRTAFTSVSRADLAALLDCRTALADLLHVLDSEPCDGFTSASLRDGYQDWLDGMLASAHAALDAAADTRSLPAPYPMPADAPDAGGGAGAYGAGSSGGRTGAQGGPDRTRESDAASDPVRDTLATVETMGRRVKDFIDHHRREPPATMRRETARPIRSSDLRLVGDDGIGNGGAA